MNIGFSTGSIAYGNFRKAIQILKGHDSSAIELSSLREEELVDLVNALDTLALGKYKYVSFHAPSKLNVLSEEHVVNVLGKVAEKGLRIVVHPDIINNFYLWRKLGNHVCIENMDKRKPVGRTYADLVKIFDRLPEATFCLDVAHARQVDPTMLECYLMLRNLSGRLVQIHLSDVTSESRHVPLNIEAINAYRSIAPMVPEGIPIILESPMFSETNQHSKIDEELRIASSIFENEVVHT